VGHALRSSGLLWLEASRTRMVHVASSWRSRGDEAKDGWVDAIGCIGLFYLKFVVFFVLGHKGSLVISFSYK
jgi:hypothetical protein